MSTRTGLDIWPDSQSPLLVDPRNDRHLIDDVEDTDLSINVLAADRALKTAFEDFDVAAQAVALVIDDAGAALVNSDDRLHAIETREADLVEVTSTYRDRFDTASDYRLTTTALSTVQEMLTDELGEDVAREFMTTIEGLEHD